MSYLDPPPNLRSLEQRIRHDGHYSNYRGRMARVKLSVSLSPTDVEALDTYARSAGLKTRSAAIQQAIRLLGDPELENAYAEAWREWEDSGDGAAWAATNADGLGGSGR